MTQLTLNLAIVGPGLVGSEFISQIKAFQHSPRLPNTRLNVSAISNSSRMMTISEGSLDLESWKSNLQNSSLKTDLDSLSDHMASLPNGIMVDCTSSDAVASQYPEWIQKKLFIITPNKKAFSQSLDFWHNLFKLAQEKGVGVFHESTVGYVDYLLNASAGLPVISTLKDLVDSGDEIIKVEGIFSGTLSYLFNNFSCPDSEKKVLFSDVVTTAKDLGYTEPDPRDDLNGMDVARKVVILGRVMGLSLDLSTLSVENIVPKQLQSVPSSEEFMTRLPEFNAHFESLNASALASKSVLRYVGVVDTRGESSVQLKTYPQSHPFASLKGSDNIIAFTTKRFPSPLIIQGAGAGAAVTAFGMFSDLIKVARMV